MYLHLLLEEFTPSSQVHKNYIYLNSVKLFRQFGRSEPDKSTDGTETAMTLIECEVVLVTCTRRLTLTFRKCLMAMEKRE